MGQLASLRPLQCGRDLIIAETIADSMNVPLFVTVLQCGRDLIIAETERTIISTSMRLGLQCGRDLIIAETMPCL